MFIEFQILFSVIFEAFPPTMMEVYPAQKHDILPKIYRHFRCSNVAKLPTPGYRDYKEIVQLGLALGMFDF